MSDRVVGDERRPHRADRRSARDLRHAPRRSGSPASSGTRTSSGRRKGGRGAAGATSCPGRAETELPGNRDHDDGDRPGGAVHRPARGRSGGACAGTAVRSARGHRGARRRRARLGLVGRRRGPRLRRRRKRMSDELTLWEQPDQPTRLRCGRDCGGARGGGARPASGSEAFAATPRPRDAQLLQLGAVREPEDVRGVHEGDRGSRSRRASTTRTRRCMRSCKAGARGYDLVCPTDYMTKQLIAGEAARAARLVEAAERQEERRPEVPQHAGRPQEHVLGRQGLGHDRLHVPDGQDQGAPDDVERVRRADEEVREDDDGRQLARGLGSIATMLGYSYNTEDKKELDEVKKVLFDLKPYIVALHSSNYDTLIAKGKAWMGLGWNGDGLAAGGEGSGAVRRRQGGRRDLDRLLQHPRRGEESGRRARVDRLRLPAEDQRRSRRRTPTTARRSSGRC